MAQQEDADGAEVFINCPFDRSFKPLLKAILFTVVTLGYTPRLASEASDSAELRLRKICRLIGATRISIHDLSRIKPEKGEYSRLNMPFELGIDYGAREYGAPPLDAKRFLITGTTPHNFKIAASDLSGVDIKAHSDQPIEVVRAVRNWFFETLEQTSASSHREIWYALEDFERDLAESRVERLRGVRPGLTLEQAEMYVADDIADMPVAEYIHRIESWVAAR